MKELTNVSKDLYGNITVVSKRRQKSYADSIGADMNQQVELNGNDFLGITLSILNTLTQNIALMCSSLSGINLDSYKQHDKHYKFTYDEEKFR